MPSNAVALIGTREGPWVSVQRCKRPHLRVAELPEGAFVEVICIMHPTLRIEADGEHPLPLSPWYRVLCSAPSPQTLCEIINKAA